MLENSNLLSGAAAKEVEKLIKDYEDIKVKVNDLETSKKAVLKRIFELAQVGTNETSRIVFNVTLNKGRISIPPKQLSEKAPDIYGFIMGKGLASIGEDYKTITGIKHKGKRA